MAKDPGYQSYVMQRAEGPLNLSIIQMRTGVDFVMYIAPQLFAKEVRDPKFLLRMLQEQAHVVQHSVEIDTYLVQYPELNCLFHPNTQLDNAFYYYKDEACTQMEAGVFDWGGAKGMPYIASMAGNLLSGAEPAMLDEHQEDVVRAWVDEYHASGGSERLTYELISTSVKLAQVSQLNGTMGFITNLLKDQPRTSPLWKQVPSRFCPEIEDNYVRRALVGQIDHVLHAWYSKKRSLYGAFLKWTQDNGDIIFPRPPLEYEVTLPNKR